MKLKTIIYLIPTIFLLSACSTNTKKPLDNKAIFLKQQQTQYEEVKNNDLNLWWQRLQDPQFLKLLKKVQDANYNAEYSFNQYETLTKKYGFDLNIPEWLLQSIKKNDSVIFKNIYWHDGRTLTSSILAQLYFEYQYCQQEQIVLKAQLINLEKLNNPNADAIENIEMILEKKDKLSTHLLKSMSYVLDIPTERLKNTITINPLNHPSYIDNNIYFTPIINAKTLLNRKDIINSIHNFYSVWNKYETPNEIIISGLIQPSINNEIDNKNTFQIGDVKVEFPDKFYSVSLEHSDVEDSKKELLENIKIAIDEIYPMYIQLNELQKDFINNQQYTESLANKILKIKEEDTNINDTQLLVLEKQYLDSLYLNLQLQKQRFTLWLQLYLLFGSGFNQPENNKQF